MYLIFKYLLTAGIVVLVSEIARRSDRLGALIASLPLVTVLTLIWLYVERQPLVKLSNHMAYTFWYVLPTLPMFLLFPWLLERFGFWMALALWVMGTAGVFLLYALLMKYFGIELL
jgi:hypothetical protein